MVDFLSNFGNQHARRPNRTLFLLLLVTILYNRHEPCLKLFIVLRRYNKITDSIEASAAEILTVKVEVTDESWLHALHDVFFNTTACSHNRLNHLVLAEILNVLAHATRRHVRGVAKENSAASILADLGLFELLGLVFLNGVIGETELDHPVDFIDSLSQRRSLEASADVGLKDFFIV
jgi:hypothetical protein